MEQPTPFSIYFDDEIKGINIFGKYQHIITKCWCFDNKYRKNWKRYFEFHDVDWKQHSTKIFSKTRENYIFVYRHYDVLKDEQPIMDNITRNH